MIDIGIGGLGIVVLITIIVLVVRFPKLDKDYDKIKKHFRGGKKNECSRNKEINQEN